VLAEIASKLELDVTEVERLVAFYDEHRLDLQWDFAATAERLDLKDEELTLLTDVVEALYTQRIGELDRWFGRMILQIKKHGLIEDSLIALTADHGELLYRENALFQWTHGLQLAPEVLQVPLLIQGAGVLPGRYEGVTRSIDVFPTLAGLCDLELPSDRTWDGTDLSSSLRGERPPPEQRAFCHTAIISDAQGTKQDSFGLRDSFFPSSDPNLMWVAVRERDLYFQYRDLGGGQWGTRVFDLASDPGLTSDLYDPSDPEHEKKEQLLKKYRSRLIEGYERLLEDPERDLPLKEQIQRLRELGYVR
jgi:arylsulfatase A-like enzyme